MGVEGRDGVGPALDSVSTNPLCGLGRRAYGQRTHLTVEGFLTTA